MTDDPTTEVAAPRPQIATGGTLAGIAPQSIEEAFRLSQALARAGDMVPSNFKGKPDEIMAAVLRGAEVGLMPMQALSNITVINGRASLWGDALPALVQRAGHHIDVVLTGEGEDMVATATLTRSNGKTVIRTFSVEDARRARLWEKSGPWTQYPQRMLMHRARAWAVRDGAADALMGLQVAEEVEDAPPIEAPAEGRVNLAKQLLEKNEEPKQKEDKGKTIDVEVKEVEHIEIDPEKAAYQEGHAAQGQGIPFDKCPYPETEEDGYHHWTAGWNDAEHEK